MTTSDLQRLLRLRYPRDQFAYFEEPPDATGSNKQRTADAWVMSLWPSRGLWTAGFELKVSRSDWLRELRQPAKAERIYANSDYWWLVVGDTSIVQPGEIPETWGLIVATNGKLRVVKDAPKLEAEELRRGFIASILRHALGQLNPQAELQRAEAEGFARGVKQATDRHEADLSRLQAIVAEFEARAGVKLNSWELGSLAEAVKIVKENRIEHYQDVLSAIRRQALRVVEAIPEQ